MAAWLIILRMPSWPIAALGLLSIGSACLNQWAGRFPRLDMHMDGSGAPVHHSRLVRYTAFSARVLLVVNGMAAAALLFGTLLGGGWV